MNASCSHRRVWAIMFCISLLLTPSFALAQRPPGLPADAYNAAATTTGVFVNGDELYAGNPGQYSFYSASATGSMAIWKRIYVPEPSKFVAVTGNGVGGFWPNNGVFPQGVDTFRVTVDPDDMNVATLDLRQGAVVRNEQLEVTQYIARGPGVPSASFTREYDILAEPSDGEGFILQPGYYFVSVLGQFGVVSEWVWTELRPSSAPSDYVRGGGDSVFNYGRVTDSALFGGFQAESGDMAFDIWMVPTDDLGDCNSYSAGATGYTPVAERPYMLFADPYMQNEIHEEDELSCQCANGTCAWTPTGVTRFRIFDVGSCNVVAEGTVTPYVNPFPECSLLGFPSDSKRFEVAGFGPVVIREQCIGSDLNGYNWADHTWLSAANPTTPQC